MTELIAKKLDMERVTILRRFNRAQGALNDALASEEVIPQKTIERRFLDFKQCWFDIQNAHDTYILTVYPDANNEEIATEDEWINKISEKFYSLEIRTDAWTCKAEAAKQSSVSTDKKISSIKLPPLKFEIFNGNIRQYPTFKMEFNKYIVPLCHASQLPMVLKSYLSMNVCEDVENVDSDVESMWRRLDEKYGDQQKLVDSIMNDVAKLTTSNTDESALKMIHTIQRAHQDLKRLNQEAELYNATILSQIERKMPTRMQWEWVQQVVSIPYTEKYQRLMPFLSEWQKRMEYNSSAIRTNKNNTDSPKLNEPQHKNNCWLHKNCEHPIWRCRLFQSLPVDERIELTRVNQACTTCLEIGHSHDACARRFKCPEDNCQANHNQLLHR